MKNKKAWIIALCVLLVLLVVVFALNRKDASVTTPAEEQQSTAGESAEASAGKTAGEGTAAGTEDGEETVNIVDETGDAEENGETVTVVSGDGEEEEEPDAAENGAPGETIEQETEDGVVIIIPEGMGIGEGND